MAISNTTLTTSIANVYVSSGNSVISVMYFCNTDITAKNINVYAVPASASTVDSTVQIYKDVQIAGGDTFVVDMEKLVLGNGDTIQASASANSAVTATASYVGI